MEWKLKKVKANGENYRKKVRSCLEVDKQLGIKRAKINVLTGYRKRAQDVINGHRGPLRLSNDTEIQGHGNLARSSMVVIYELEMSDMSLTYQARECKA